MQKALISMSPLKAKTARPTSALNAAGDSDFVSVGHIQGWLLDVTIVLFWKK